MGSHQLYVIPGVASEACHFLQALGSVKAKDKKEEFLSQIISRLNELINYAYTVSDKLSENALVMSQIANNTPEQAMLGDFSKATRFARVVFDLLSQGKY